jgi:hypothetical protein
LTTRDPRREHRLLAGYNRFAAAQYARRHSCLLPRARGAAREKRSCGLSPRRGLKRGATRASPDDSDGPSDPDGDHSLAGGDAARKRYRVYRHTKTRRGAAAT